jgi:hypothetical protein
MNEHSFEVKLGCYGIDIGKNSFHVVGFDGRGRNRAAAEVVAWSGRSTLCQLPGADVPPSPLSIKPIRQDDAISEGGNSLYNTAHTLEERRSRRSMPTPPKERPTARTRNGKLTAPSYYYIHAAKRREPIMPPRDPNDDDDDEDGDEEGEEKHDEEPAVIREPDE